MDRKRFLRLSGILAGGSLLPGNQMLARSSQDKFRHPVGLQLFTFFETMDADVTGTLRKIADIGYREIESAFSKKGAYYGMKAKAFGAYLASIGLSWKSHHVLGAPFQLPKGSKMPTGSDGKPIQIPPIKNLRDNMQEIIDDIAEAGVPYLVCASTPIDTPENIKKSIDVLNKSAEACHQAGITFCYHNHDKEFHEVGGKIPYDLLLSETDPAHLKFELDIAWAIKGGRQPRDLFEQNPGRFPLWHVKNLSADYEKIQPVSQGIIDYPSIFPLASVAGMEHFFVEHDMPRDPFASITDSYQYLTHTLKV